jgi:hypothetical protein
VSGGRFRDDAFGRNLASVAVKMFAHLLYFKKILQMFYFNAIYKRNAELNCTNI